MIWFDLLYPSRELWEQGKEGGRAGACLARDLQLERLAEDEALGGEELERLCRELEHLPVDREVILFRQAVLEDLIRNPHFLEKCGEFCRRLKSNVPVKRNIWDPPVPVYKNLEEHIGVLESNYSAICTANLGAETGFRSEALLRLTEFLEKNEYRERLREIIELLRGILSSGAVRYRPEYTFGQVMDSVTVQDVLRTNTYVTKEKGLLKKTVVDRDYLIPAENIILYNNMDEIFSKTVVKLCDFASRLNGAIVNAFKRIQGELSYYQAGVRLYELYRRQGIEACLPRVEEGRGARMEFDRLYPVHLLAKKPAGEIQCNSYSNEEGKLAVVMGHNSGGKTTFLTAVGTAQILMQFGFYVPAASFRACAVPFIGSLFAGGEDADTVYGKLEMELTDIRAMAGSIREGSLLLMNEILATTSEKEGADIAAEVLGAFSRTHSHMIFVTHLKRLADMAREGRLALAEGERAVNYVTEQAETEDGRTEKTYRIRKGCPEAGIFERELFDRYFAAVCEAQS